MLSTTPKSEHQLSESLKISEFKFSNDSYQTRLKFFDLINSFQIDAGAVAIRKDSVSASLRDNPNILYNYLAVHHIVPVLIQNYLKSRMPINRIKFIIDKSLTRVNRNRFNDYYDSSISVIRRKEDFNADILAEIAHVNSHDDVCLQIADYVAGAVFHMTEMNDRQYYDIINQKIKYREKWDWHGKICW